MKASKNLEYEKKLLELRLEGINKGIAKNRRFIQLFHKRLKLLSLSGISSGFHLHGQMLLTSKVKVVQDSKLLEFDTAQTS
jgi:hypothetical protein